MTHARSALLLALLTLISANASAVTDVEFTQNRYEGELNPSDTFDFISLPIDGAVSVSDIEGCEFEGAPRAYGYNEEVYRKNVIHGNRGNIIPLESSCEFSIEAGDIIYSNQPRDIISNEWVIFSPTIDRKVENLGDAVAPCDLNGVEGVPTYQVSMSGNDPKVDGTLEAEKSYWIRVEGDNCEIDFLGQTTKDISVQIDKPSEPLTVGEQYPVKVIAESDSEGLDSIELNNENTDGEIELDGANSCLSVGSSLTYNCQKTFQYTPGEAGDTTLVASVSGIDSVEEEDRITLDVDNQDEGAPGGDTQSEIDYRFFVANGDSNTKFDEVQSRNDLFGTSDFEYQLLFRAEAYEKGTDNRVNVFKPGVKFESVEMTVKELNDQGKVKIDGVVKETEDCSNGADNRCSVPGFVGSFPPGKYEVTLSEPPSYYAESPEEIAVDTVTLPSLRDVGRSR